ncbi:hypothetical protein ACFLYX_00755 [Chloroflexota bacterium]
MASLIVFTTIFSGIAAIGAVINIVVLVKNRQKSVIKEHISDEETQPDLDEQYRLMYVDRQEPDSK